MYSRSERDRERESKRETEKKRYQQLPGLIGVITPHFTGSRTLAKFIICADLWGFFSQANLFEMLLLKTDAVSICVEGLKVRDQGINIFYIGHKQSSI